MCSEWIDYRDEIWVIKCVFRMIFCYGVSQRKQMELQTQDVL